MSREITEGDEDDVLIRALIEKERIRLVRAIPRHAGFARLLNPDEEGPEVRGYATEPKG